MPPITWLYGKVIDTGDKPILEELLGHFLRLPYILVRDVNDDEIHIGILRQWLLRLDHLSINNVTIFL